MNKKIFIKDWLALKPYNKHTSIDIYYLDIANKVKKAIVNNINFHFLLIYLDENDVNLLSCFLTSYLEDLVSETNIWKTFVRLHEKEYNKKLPFYELDDYYDDNTNVQDVAFLIWYFLNTIQDEKFIYASSNSYILEIAHSVTNELDEEWEYAPENEILKSFYQIPDNESNFYPTRYLIDVILFQTYLFYTDTYIELKISEKEILDDEDSDEFLNIDIKLYLNRDDVLQKSKTKLLALSGKEWASEILAKNHPLKEDIKNISNKITGLFLYKGQDETNIQIEHIASSKKFNITKKSYEKYEDLKEIDKILFIGITKWQNEWWFSGTNIVMDYDHDLVLEEKKSIESIMQVNFIDEEEKKDEFEKHLESQLNAFKKYNNGYSIAFMSKNEVEKFTKGYYDFFNESLHLSKQEIEKSEKRIKEDGFLSENDLSFDISDKEEEEALVFFNPKSGVEILLANNSAFPLPNNPYFYEDLSTNDLLNLFMSDQISTELALFCIDNCKEKLPFFNTKEGESYLENIDFLLRFCKNKNYKTKSSMTIR